MTNHYIDMKNASCFLVFSNPAENHPSCMQWVLEAKSNGAKIIVVDPRRTRTANIADQHVRIRPGTDIAFISGILKRHFANVDAGDTSMFDDLGSDDNIAPGPGSYLRTAQVVDSTVRKTHWFHDKATMNGMYWPKWTDALFRTNEGYGGVPSGKPTDYLRYGRDIDATASSTERDSDPNWAGGAGWLAANGAWANQNQIPVLAPDLNATSGSMTVYETYKARVAAYDSAKVADVCGCSAGEFQLAADTYLANSWCSDPKKSGYKAATILYAMGTTQHTHGSQNVKSCANLQVCTGNIGKFGGGVNALRGIGNVQGSTDMNLLYHILMAYVAVPYKTGKITNVVDAWTVDVKGKPALPLHNHSDDPGYDNTKPEVCSRVLLGDGNGFLKAGAPTYAYGASPGYPNCGTPVVSVTDQGGGIWRVVTADNLGAPAVGDTLFQDYESWLFQKSFGGRTVYPEAGGGNAAGTANAWKFSGGLPWGHQGSWAVIRTFFSEGMANADGAATGLLIDSVSRANDLYNRYCPKGNGMDHRTMVAQTDPGRPGYSSDKADVKGWVVWGMNPRVTVANSTNVGEAQYNLDFLVVVDMFRTETADADRKTDAPTYFLPAASPLETAGTTSNSGRWIQWRYQAIPPKGRTADGTGCKTDMEILLKMARYLHNSGGLPALGYADGQTAYEKIWRDQYAGGGGGAGILQGVGICDGSALPDPATAWDNDAYRRSLEGHDEGFNPATDASNGPVGGVGFGVPGYAERVAIQTNTNAADAYGNAGTNWLHGSKTNGGGGYGAFHVGGGGSTTSDFNVMPADAAENARSNRTQARGTTDAASGKGLYPGFGWVWLRNRRNFYNKGGFCPGDVGDIFVSPDEVGTLLQGVPGYTNRPPVVPYTGAWRGSRNMTDIPIKSADKVWEKLGYTPVHWEPHESPRPDLVAAHGQIGRPSDENYAETSAEIHEFPFVLTNFRHTEHYQGGAMTRNVPWLNELVPKATIEISSYDAAANGIQSGYKVWLRTARTPESGPDAKPDVGPFIAVVGSGLAKAQRVGKGVLAIPWHWGSCGLSIGPTANDLCNDAGDGNTNMPETKACLCKISRVEL